MLAEGEVTQKHSCSEVVSKWACDPESEVAAAAQLRQQDVSESCQSFVTVTEGCIQISFQQRQVFLQQ